MLGKDKSRLTPIKRLFRTTFSVFILTAFILGIAFFVRNLSSVDTSRLISLASPVLEKLGLSPEDVGEVAGEFAERLADTNLKSDTSEVDTSETLAEDILKVSADDSKVAASSIAIIADIHSSIPNLELAMAKIKTLETTEVLCI